MKHLLRLLIFGLLSLPVSVEAANRFGVCTVTCTWDASSTAMWSTSTGGGTGASVPGSGDAVVLDAATCVGGVTCTITVNTTVTVQSIAMGACTASTTGCILDFSANNNNVTLTAATGISGSGSGVRTINLGNGTWTLTGTSGTPWNFNTITNLTLNANSSTIAFTATTASNRTFSGGGKTYSTVTFSANTSRGGVTIGGANTFATLNVIAPQTLIMPSGATNTITNAFNFAGSETNPIGVISNAPNNTTATISVATGSPTMIYAGINSMVFTGGATFTATNSFDLGMNSGITITGPSAGGGGGPNIIGGWLLNRDLSPTNDNNPAFLHQVA